MVATSEGLNIGGTKMKQDLSKEFEAMHRRLGCEGCKYADKQQLFKDACCTRWMQIETDKSGKCLIRVGG